MLLIYGTMHPYNGPLFHEKNTARTLYKRGLRIAKNSNDTEVSDEFSSNLLSKDSDTFWKNWNKLESKNNEVTRIDGCTKHSDIANSFAKTFSEVYESTDVIAESKLHERFSQEFTKYRSNHMNDNLESFFVTWSEFLDCLAKIKTGKATGSFVKAQHIFHGSPKLAVHLHILFNGLIQHGYVPYEFLSSTITPIIKSRTGDIYCSNNYRPIALSNLFSQLFELVLLVKIGHLLFTDDLQFGFKRKHSTSHALFVLKESVDYFTKHGSNVFVTFLDCSKAFDKISHHGLFLKLIDRGVPLCFINILVYWLSNLKSRCRWKEVFSEYFSVPSGIKQGGILSPGLFTVYIDDLLKRLRSKGIGCHLISLFLAAIMFADDLALLAPTRGAMQDMIHICEEYCSEFCLSFNTKKTKSMIFGNGHTSLKPLPLVLNGQPVEYVSEWTYLGCLVQTDKHFRFSCKNDLRSFRSSANSILSAVKKPSEQIFMQLLYSICVPILTYATEIKEFSCADMLECHVALNDAIRRVFGYNRWESTTVRRVFVFYVLNLVITTCIHFLP